MSYVQRVVQPGEQVRHISSIHWIVYWPGVGRTPSGGCLLLQRNAVPDRSVAVYGIRPRALALVAVGLLIQQWFRWWITEIAVTDRRVIYKKGLVRRQTNEMNMDKVESVKINQSILGRLLDYGDVPILGTGEGFETLRTIASPIENSITGTAHKA